MAFVFVFMNLCVLIGSWVEIFGRGCCLGKSALHEAAFSVFWPVYSQQYTYAVF